MGAIDPVVSRQHVKTKSASVESGYSMVRNSGREQLNSGHFKQVAPSIRCPPLSVYDSSDDEDDDEFFYYKKSHPTVSAPRSSSASATNKQRQMPQRTSNSFEIRTNPIPDKRLSKAHSTSQDTLARPALASPSTGDRTLATGPATRAKNFLSVAMGGFSPLRPAVSMSCLFSSPSQLNLAAKIGDDKRHKPDEQKKEGTKNAAALGLIPTRASLTHEWRKLRTPNKCRECNLLVYFNGRECCHCAFVAHKKCLVTLVIKCSRQQQHTSFAETLATSAPLTRAQPAPKVRPIFGRALDQVDQAQLFDFVMRFIYEIDTRGLTARGIYRVSSIKSKVDRLCQYFDHNSSSLVDLSSFHPNIIANALKIYLRQLPEPLLTQKLYQRFIDIAKKYSNNTQNNQNSSSSSCTSSSSSLCTSNASAIGHTKNKRSLEMLAQQASSVSLPLSRPSSTRNKPNARALGSVPKQIGTQAQQESGNINYDHTSLIENIRSVTDCLPAINRELVALLMRHLRRVADMQEENQMSAKNLSIIFGPTLLDLERSNKSLAIVDNIHQARIVELMIQWAYEIFPCALDEHEEASAPIEPDYSSHVSC